MRWVRRWVREVSTGDSVSGLGTVSSEVGLPKYQGGTLQLGAAPARADAASLQRWRSAAHRLLLRVCMSSPCACAAVPTCLVGRDGDAVVRPLCVGPHPVAEGEGEGGGSRSLSLRPWQHACFGHPLAERCACWGPAHWAAAPDMRHGPGRKRRRSKGRGRAEAASAACRTAHCSPRCAGSTSQRLGTWPAGCRCSDPPTAAPARRPRLQGRGGATQMHMGCT